MVPPKMRRRAARGGWRTPLGLVMVMLGALGLTGLLVLAYAQTPGLERMFFKLGLGLPGLLAAIALTLLMAGAWLMLSTRRPRASRDRRRG